MGKRRRKRIAVGPCVLCGHVRSRTEEHIPPRNLWPRAKAIQKQLVWVPACLVCNASSSKDDEYFRFVVTQGLDTGDHPEALLLTPPVARSLARPQFPGFARSLFDRSFEVELRTGAGLFVGTTRAVPIAAKRVQRVAEKIVRGLFFIETGAIMPRTHKVEALVAEQLPLLSAEDQARAVQYVNSFMGSTFKRGGPGNVFAYSHRLQEQPEGVASVWLLVFFQRLGILAVATAAA